MNKPYVWEYHPGPYVRVETHRGPIGFYPGSLSKESVVYCTSTKYVFTQSLYL